MWQCAFQSCFFWYIIYYLLSVTEVNVSFACEVEKFKQNLLIEQVLSGTHACLFADVTLIHDDTQRQCVRHGRACVTWPVSIDHGVSINHEVISTNHPCQFHDGPHVVCHI